MGLAKRHLEETEARGYGDTDRVVCAGCIGDPYIHNRIRYSHRSGTCSFCGSHRNILPLEEVLAMMMPVIRRDYLPALDNVPWDREEGYLSSAHGVYDPYEFVYEELNTWLEIENDDLLQEIADTLAAEDRVSVYRFSLRQEERDMEKWKEYSELVTNTPLSAEQIVSLTDKPDRLPEDLQAIWATLDMVYDYCRELRLTTDLYGLSSQFRPRSIYRCVNFLDWNPDYAGLSFIPATLVGTAPARSVEDNRMSEKGDMMFYGAEDKRVAATEVGRNASCPSRPATIGTFHPGRRLRVLDLTDIASWKLPGIFDVEHEKIRSCWFFLKAFTDLISQEKRDGDSYKPTQVLTKYIQRKTDLQGIRYNSSKVRDGNRGCYVLFVTNRDCLEKGDCLDTTRNQLVMEKVEQVDFAGMGI